MVYATAGLKCAVPGIGTQAAIWTYTSVDAHGVVEASGYFTDAGDRGMKVGDIMIVVDSDTAGNTTVHSVTVVDAAGLGTISVALLA